MSQSFLTVFKLRNTLILVKRYFDQLSLIDKFRNKLFVTNNTKFKRLRSNYNALLECLQFETSTIFHFFTPP